MFSSSDLKSLLEPFVPSFTSGLFYFFLNKDGILRFPKILRFLGITRIRGRRLSQDIIIKFARRVVSSQGAMLPIKSWVENEIRARAKENGLETSDFYLPFDIFVGILSYVHGQLGLNTDLQIEILEKIEIEKSKCSPEREPDDTPPNPPLLPPPASKGLRKTAKIIRFDRIKNSPTRGDRDNILSSLLLLALGVIIAVFLVRVQVITDSLAVLGIAMVASLYVVRYGRQQYKLLSGRLRKREIKLVVKRKLLLEHIVKAVRSMDGLYGVTTTESPLIDRVSIRSSNADPKYIRVVVAPTVLSKSVVVMVILMRLIAIVMTVQKLLLQIINVATGMTLTRRGSTLVVIGVEANYVIDERLELHSFPIQSKTVDFVLLDVDQ